MKSPHSSLPLSALLSQTLVAFTIEFDNEFALRMINASYQVAGLSLVVWENLMRFIPADGVTLEDLATHARTSIDAIKFKLGCLERWRFIVLPSDSAKKVKPTNTDDRRPGWGSGRGIRKEWIVRLTSKGKKASEIWPSLFDLIEQRWQKRFGENNILRLRQNLEAILAQIHFELPLALDWLDLDHDNELSQPKKNAAPNKNSQAKQNFALSALLSQLLMAFTLEFDREIKTPLSLCASVLRVLGEDPVPLADIPRLTGSSPETTAIGWRLKPFVIVESATARRGKVVRLSELGLRVQRKYQRLTIEIEQRWQERYGEEKIADLRESLLSLFEDRAAMAEGLTPPPSVARAGAATPALGRKKVASAAIQRVRDMAAQTEAFVRDPAASLPHYPLWDMNRGFGP